MKRIVCVLLTLIMALSLFSGCGGEMPQSAETSEASVSSAVESMAPDPQGSEKTSAVESVESSAEEAVRAEEFPVELPLVEETKTLTLYTSKSPILGDNTPELNETMVLQELEKRTNVHIDVTAVTAMAFTENFMLMIAGGDWTDILQNVRTTYSGGLAAALNEEVILDLQDYAEYMPNYMAKITSDDNLYRDVTLGGGQIGAFYDIFDEERPLDAGLMVRGDWLEAQKMDAPVTVDDFYAYLQVMNQEYGAVMHLPTNSIMAYQAFMSAYGIAGFFIDAGFYTSLQCFSVEDNKLICGYTQEGFKEYLQLMAKWYAEGLIDPDYISAASTSNYLSDNSDALAGLLNDKYSLWGDSADTVVKYEAGTAVDPNFRVRAVALPVLNEGDTIQCGAYVGRVDEAFYSLSTTCSNPELAVRWIDYAYTTEGSDLYNWGIEDVTYTVNADGSKQYTDLILDNDDFTTLLDAKYAYLGGGAYGRTLEAWHATHNEFQMQCFDVWNSNFTGEKAISTQLALTPEESARFSTISGDMITYLNECVAKFVVGDLNFEGDYDNFLNQLESLGISELIEIEQAVYDRWAGIA